MGHLRRPDPALALCGPHERQARRAGAHRRLGREGATELLWEAAAEFPAGVEIAVSGGGREGVQGGVYPGAGRGEGVGVY